MQQLILSKRRRLGKTEPLRSPSSGKTRAKKLPAAKKTARGALRYSCSFSRSSSSQTSSSASQARDALC